MKITLTCIVTAFLFLTGCQEASLTAYEEEINTISNRLKELYDSSSLSGFSVAVLRDNEIFMTRHFGHQEYGGDTPVTDDTLFEASSLGKLVFAYMTLRMVDEGLLELDKPLLDYVEEEQVVDSFLEEPLKDENFRQLTLRIALANSTGVPNLRQLLGRDAEVTYIRDPNLVHDGRGLDIYLAQRVAEALTGASLEQLAKKYVFEPLDMVNSSYDFRSIDLNRLAIRTEFLGTVHNWDENNLLSMLAAASMTTTASDFSRFLIALNKGTGLSDEMHTEMLTPHLQIVTQGGRVDYWGLGIGMLDDGESNAIYNWGDSLASKALVYLNRESGDGLVYFCHDRLGMGLYRPIVRAACGEIGELANSFLLRRYLNHTTLSYQVFIRYRQGGFDGVSEYQMKLLLENGEGAFLPKRAVALLGYRLMRLERFDEARAAFEMNTLHYPESPHVWHIYAEVHQRMGKINAARQYYQRALELDPDFPNSLQALKELNAE